jgi:hypothetical protein
MEILPGSRSAWRYLRQSHPVPNFNWHSEYLLLCESVNMQFDIVDPIIFFSASRDANQSKVSFGMIGDHARPT